MSILHLVPYAPGRLVHWGPDGPPEDDTMAKRIRRENATAEARSLDDEDLDRRTSILAYMVADDSGTDEEQALRAVFYGGPYQAFLEEIKRREGLFARGRVHGSEPDKRTIALYELKDAIKQHVSIIDILEREVNVWPFYIGKKESHSVCPACGGKDRLVIYHDHPDQFWCRRCEWFGDVIDFAGQVWGIDIQHNGGFRAVVERISRDYLGLSDA